MGSSWTTSCKFFSGSTWESLETKKIVNPTRRIKKTTPKMNLRGPRDEYDTVINYAEPTAYYLCLEVLFAASYDRTQGH